MQNMLIMGRLSYIQVYQLNEKSTTLTKKDQLVEELREKNEVIVASCVAMHAGMDQNRLH